MGMLSIANDCLFAGPNPSICAMLHACSTRISTILDLLRSTLALNAYRQPWPKHGSFEQMAGHTAH